MHASPPHKALMMSGTAVSLGILLLLGCSSAVPTRPLPWDDGPAATQPSTAPAAAIDWKEYTSKDHGFSILFPGKVTAEKDGEGFVYGATTEFESYLVRVDALDKELDNLNETLDLLRDRNVKARKGKLVRETKVTLGGKHPGRDLLIEEVDRYDRTRVFIVHRRFLFHVSVVGNTKEDATGATADKFLESFKLID